jgi:hypothetical protein
MAKKTKAGPNKSDSIRAYFADHPHAGPTEVVQALSAQGVEVSVALVSAIKGKLKGKKGKRGRKKGPAAKTQRGAKTRAGSHEKVSLNMLLAAKKLANQLGGIAKARQALDLLSKLS